MSVRIAKTVLIGGMIEREVSVEVAEDADEYQVGASLAALEDIGDRLTRLASCCYVPPGAVHRPTCHAAPLDLIKACREEALAMGMRP